jgi:hypothetical protein
MSKLTVVSPAAAPGTPTPMERCPRCGVAIVPGGGIVVIEATSGALPREERYCSQTCLNDALRRAAGLGPRSARGDGGTRA